MNSNYARALWAFGIIDAEERLVMHIRMDLMREWEIWL